MSKSPYNFSRCFSQTSGRAASLTKVAASFSRITFPDHVCRFVFGKRYHMVVVSHITFRLLLRMAAFASSQDLSCSVPKGGCSVTVGLTRRVGRRREMVQPAPAKREVALLAHPPAHPRRP